MQHDEYKKIDLTIGFANFGGEDFADIVAEDITALSPLFSRFSAPSNGLIPDAEVLFLYLHLNEDGSIKNLNKVGIRQVVELVGSQIVVLASPNSCESIKNAFELPGPKTANLVFTVDRNSKGFSRFFRELFEKMLEGKPMVSAWVELSPQHPKSSPAYAPHTVMAIEAGNLGFPIQIQKTNE